MDERVKCPYCGDVFSLGEGRISQGLESSGGTRLIKVPCCSCGRMFGVTLTEDTLSQWQQRSNLSSKA